MEDDMSWHYYGFRPYVSVAQRRANAAKELKKLQKKGQVISPVTIDGREIARTFWGKAWCDHLESYSDIYNRLERGRRYVRNGSVVDLQINPGQVTARVAGSELYTVDITIKPLAAALWKSLRGTCAGQIGSIVELLQGKLSTGVMAIMTCRDRGLFPDPKQIEMDCSCPDYAGVCKHVAAVLYGVGARLDAQPELLFRLRNVDHLELIAGAGDVEAITRNRAATTKKTIAVDQLGDVFGIDLAVDAPAPKPEPAPAQKGSTKTRKPSAKRPAAAAPAKPKGRKHTTR
jgi:uncharacterized Zn finger protein